MGDICGKRSRPSPPIEIPKNSHPIKDTYDCGEPECIICHRKLCHSDNDSEPEPYLQFDIEDMPPHPPKLIRQFAMTYD